MPHRYPPAYRQTETDFVFQRTGAGESVCIVGVSGTGKSNFVRHLLTQARQPGRLPASHTWVVVAVGRISHNDSRLSYAQLLESILYALAEMGWPEPALQPVLELMCANVRAAADELQAQLGFKQAIAHLLRNERTRLILIWDSFDTTFIHATDAFLVALTDIRNQFRYQITYVLLSRDPLLRRRTDIAAEDFYGIVRSHTRALGGHAPQDALAQIEEMSRTLGIACPPERIKQLMALSGGHPGLLRCIFIAWAEGTLAIQDLDDQDHVAQNRQVHEELNDLWQSLLHDEQTMLVNHVLSLVESMSLEARDYLIFKRILDEQGVLTFPVFGTWIRLRQVKPLQPRVAQNRAWIGDIELPLSGRVFRLFECLCTQVGQPVSLDDIIVRVYDGELETSNAAIEGLVRQLRKRLEAYPLAPTVKSFPRRGYGLILANA